MPMLEPTAAYRVAIAKFDIQGIPVWRFTALPGDRPPVIVLHGLTSRKERHLELCLELAEAGFSAWILDLRSHGDRRDEDSAALRGSRTAPEFIPPFVRCVAGSAEDVAAIADALGMERYGIIGHSLGGFVALQTALRDTRAAAVVNIAGSIDASGSLPGGPTLRDIPANARNFAPRPLLLLHGTEDRDVPIAGARKFHAAFRHAYGADADRARLIEYPDVHHELLPEMRTAAVNWMRQHLMQYAGSGA